MVGQHWLGLLWWNDLKLSEWVFVLNVNGQWAGVFFIPMGLSVGFCA